MAQMALSGKTKENGLYQLSLSKKVLEAIMAEANFDRAFDALLGNEGGYVNNPKDPGGETNFGITVAVARAYGYNGSMRQMPQATAKAIYRTKYWLKQFDEMPYAVAFQMFDGAVNSGLAQSVKWLQRALAVKDDGVIGPATMAALAKADPLAVVIRYNAARLTFLTSLPTWTTFGKGWAGRIAGNLLKAVT
jgi:lysozyme family protein